MEFAESLQTMQNQRKEILTKIKEKNLAMSEKNRIFASDDDEPTALAVDSGRPIPTLTGESARIFLERAAKVEEGMEVKAGDGSAVITRVETGPDGKSYAVAETTMADGIYNVKVCYKKTRVLEFLFGN